MKFDGMKSTLAITLLFTIIVSLNSCTKEKSDLLISESTYKDVFLELAIANHLDTRLLENISREELIDQIFDHYEITPEQFRYTHDYFEKDIDKQAKRMEQILVMLREERERIDTIEQEYHRQNAETADSLRQRPLSR